MDAPTAKAAEKIAKKTREEKLREQKIESEIVKSLNAIADPDQKFQVLLHRCVEAERISRSATIQQKQNQKTIETLLLEKDNLAGEHQRILQTKAKLESLCRELQNQNRSIKVSSSIKVNKIKLKSRFRKIRCQRFARKRNDAKKHKQSSNTRSTRFKS